jgi:DNA-binding NtrC family response regulator
MLLFKKFASDFAEKYRMPVLSMTPDAERLFVNYSWPGNVRQLKNITEQMSVLERERIITPETITLYLPHESFSTKPMVAGTSGGKDWSEREILYKVLFDMKNDLNDLKKLVLGIIREGGNYIPSQENAALLQKVFAGQQAEILDDDHEESNQGIISFQPSNTSITPQHHVPVQSHHEVVEETLSLSDSEKELIRRALAKHKNKRKYAAEELGISERTLYRKIKEYNLK